MIHLVESRVHALDPNADVMIHAQPHTPPVHDPVEKVLWVAGRMNLAIHNVTAYSIEDVVHIDLDLELDPALTLDRAHREATSLEETVLKELPAVGSVTVHLEPRSKRVESGKEAPDALPLIEKKILEIARQNGSVHDCHSVAAGRVGDNILVSLHCTLDGKLLLEQVHDITEELKLRFRAAFPQILRVNIHAEPIEQIRTAPSRP